ncbi:MAG: hypothetical protein ACLSHG_04405 [Oscillospiraceae bacterium]
MDATFEAEHDNPSYHPGRCAKGYHAGGKPLGVLGQIHPLAAANYGAWTRSSTRRSFVARRTARRPRHAIPVYIAPAALPGRDARHRHRSAPPISRSAKLSACILAAGGQCPQGLRALFGVVHRRADPGRLPQEPLPSR